MMMTMTGFCTHCGRQQMWLLVACVCMRVCMCFCAQEWLVDCGPSADDVRCAILEADCTTSTHHWSRLLAIHSNVLQPHLCCVTGLMPISALCCVLVIYVFAVNLYSAFFIFTGFLCCVCSACFVVVASFAFSCSIHYFYWLLLSYCRFYHLNGTEVAFFY